MSPINEIILGQLASEHRADFGTDDPRSEFIRTVARSSQVIADECERQQLEHPRTINGLLRDLDIATAAKVVNGTASPDDVIAMRGALDDRGDVLAFHERPARFEQE